ncbi:MAG: MarR family transcriptional regulator [Balneolaceae bacterium]
MYKNDTTTHVYQNEWQRLRTNIRKTEAWLRTNINEFLSQFEITHQQLTILRILRDANNEPISTKEIGTKMMDKNSDVSRLVDRLVDKGLVRKRKSTTDGRLVQVSINYEGLKILAKIDDHKQDLDQRFSLLSEDEAEQLNFLLEKARS